MEFKTPLFLCLIPLLWTMLWFWHRRPAGSLSYSSLDLVKESGSTWKSRSAFMPLWLRLVAVALLCVALAGPRKILEESKVSSEGIDIVLALDCSGSMAAEDFQIEGRRTNRFDIIKKVVAEFINQRASDQIGLIGFAGKAYTVCPLTTDRKWLQSNLERMRLGLIEDGTAIGSGIATSIGRFKNSQAKSKVVILLTDGVNNAGSMDPLTAARAAAANGIKIYTIGAGTNGFAPFPVKDMLGRTFYQNVQIDLDEETLKKISEVTHGQYFRATDTEALRNVYRAIDQLEKTKIEHTGYREYRELFGYVLLAALTIILLELALANTLFLKIP